MTGLQLSSIERLMAGAGVAAFEFDAPMLDLLRRCDWDVRALRAALIDAGCVVPSSATIMRRWRRLPPDVRRALVLERASHRGARRVVRIEDGRSRQLGEEDPR